MFCCFFLFHFWDQKENCSYYFPKKNCFFNIYRYKKDTIILNFNNILFISLYVWQCFGFWLCPFHVKKSFPRKYNRSCVGDVVGNSAPIFTIKNVNKQLSTSFIWVFFSVYILRKKILSCLFTSVVYYIKMYISERSDIGRLNTS